MTQPVVALERQAMTQPVVALERPTWSLMMTGVLMLEPTRAWQMISKSTSFGAAELQTGTLTNSSPGKSALASLIAVSSVFSSFTSTSFSFLLMSITFSFPLSLDLPSRTLWNSGSSLASMSAVTAPSSAYSPILFGGLAHTGSPLTYTSGSCLTLNQRIFPSLG